MDQHKTLDLPSRTEYWSDQCKRWWCLKILYNTAFKVWTCDCLRAKKNYMSRLKWASQPRQMNVVVLSRMTVHRLPPAHPQLHSNTTRRTQRVPLSRLAGSARRSGGSQMPSLAFAFTVLVATIALLFGHWTSANLHHTNNTTERPALVP